MTVAEAAGAAQKGAKARGASPLDARWRVYWLFTLPALLCVALFVAVPLVYAFWLSLRDFNLLLITDRFVGLANYQKALTDPEFLASFFRTILYVVVVVSVDFILGFTQALLLFRLPLTAAKLLRGVFILPILLVPSAAAMLWRSVMYGPPFLEFNRAFGLPESFVMLAQPNTAFLGIIITVIWAWSPWVFLLLLGGLEAMDPDPLEAAELDGANFLQSVWYIILPMMRPVIFVALSFKAVDSFLTFPFPWTMTQGGPAGSTHVLSTYIYESATKFLNYGYGSSLALLMLLIGTILSTAVILFAWRKGYVE
ncbi:MAG: sugar ABC transporter permease [Chloroflexi bacterium]|nr:sugar ABC transporter permease [Chloroflexota bacterium]